MIRDTKDSDIPAFKAIHAESQFDYKFPDLSDPLFITKKTVEEDGRPVQGIALKLQAECYIYVDHSWGTPEQRWERLQELCEEAKLAAWEKGLDFIVCSIPPEIADSFEKRLKQIGMLRDRDWPSFSFDLTQYTPTNRVESIT